MTTPRVLFIDDNLEMINVPQPFWSELQMTENGHTRGGSAQRNKAPRS